MKPNWQTEDGAIQLYLGDCLDILPTLSGVDAVVVDPPYGIAHESHGSLFIGFDGIAGDDSTATAEAIRAVARKLQACCVMFFSPYQPLSGFRSVLCWDKGAHVGIGGDRATCWKRDFELIGIEGNRPLLGQRDSAVVRINALLPPPSGHAHEKPLALMHYLIGKIDADTVCDPCMGSGTTGVACVRLGRRFIGIEREPKYFEIAKKRIGDELQKLRLFEPPPKIIQRELLAT